MKSAEIAGFTTREPENTSTEMMVAIGGSFSDLATPDDGEDREDKNDEETERGKLSEDG